MADDMSLAQIPLTLIVAATTKNGIGKNGSLPWPMLKKDMAYFARVTKRVPIPRHTGSLQSDTLKRSILEDTQRNVVIMGRKTWESIPPKLRPLKERTNIVISSQSRSELQDIPDDVVVASDIPTALQRLERLIKDDQAMNVGRAFVIGGTSIYKAALELPQTSRILLTRIDREYDCDTFFPENLNATSSKWQRQSHDELQAFVGEQIENGPVAQQVGDEPLTLDFQLFERT